MYPTYSYPPRLAVGFLRDLLLGRRRSFRIDAQACIQRLTPPLRVLAEEKIPQSGPCLITFNHYYRSGFNAWWIALAVAASVPAEMHWVMTGELTYPGKWYAFLGKPSSRWLLRRLAKMYGFTTMPPMPPRLKDVVARAHSVRLVLEYVRHSPRPMLAVAPEGGDNPPGGELAWPPPGAGRFLLLMAEAGLSVVPVGCWEQDGELCLRFGTAYKLQVPPRFGPDERDRHAAETVMRAIAAQLPPHLRGEFQ